MRLTLAMLICCAAVVTPAAAQIQLARIEGSVVDSQGQALDRAVVQLEDSLGTPIRAQETDASGRFTFASIAPGRYTLRATVPGLDPLLVPIVLDGSLPIDVTLRLPLRVSGTVVVEGAFAREAIGSQSTVAGTSIALAPIRVRQQGIQDVIATLPGWATEDNGLLHSRGVDDGFLYVIDGVPVYERLDQLLGVSPDVSTLESVSVVTGYVPAEFGHKAGGVIDVRTRAAAANWTTAIEVERASQDIPVEARRWAEGSAARRRSGLARPAKSRIGFLILCIRTISTITDSR